MPTELNFARLAWLAAAIGIVVAIFIGVATPIPEGWDKAAHFTAFSALTLCLWQANAGKTPLVILAAVLAFAAIDEWRQAYIPGRFPDAQDFLADLAAVAATGALLFKQRKRVCAESSPR
jgi:VanZ family protein